MLNCRERNAGNESGLTGNERIMIKNELTSVGSPIFSYIFLFSLKSIEESLQRDWIREGSWSSWIPEHCTRLPL